MIRFIAFPRRRPPSIVEATAADTAALGLIWLLSLLRLELLLSAGRHLPLCPAVSLGQGLQRVPEPLPQVRQPGINNLLPLERKGPARQN